LDTPYGSETYIVALPYLYGSFPSTKYMSYLAYSAFARQILAHLGDVGSSIPMEAVLAHLLMKLAVEPVPNSVD
jgi:hypothetical protein